LPIRRILRSCATIDRTYPLDQVPTAMRHLEGGTVKGKIAITI
jgi:NADPH:quinone reductase-like Zn-dependent oxidoreductase